MSSSVNSFNNTVEVSWVAEIASPIEMIELSSVTNTVDKSRDADIVS